MARKETKCQTLRQIPIPALCLPQNSPNTNFVLTSLHFSSYLSTETRTHCSNCMSPHPSAFALPLATLLLLLALSSLILLTEANPKFLLSCKVIAGICQNDELCLDEMSMRFPDCYLERKISTIKSPPALIEDEANASQRFLKRTPAMKLMKVLMMKDRIPVGRR